MEMTLKNLKSSPLTFIYVIVGFGFLVDVFWVLILFLVDEVSVFLILLIEKFECGVDLFVGLLFDFFVGNLIIVIVLFIIVLIVTGPIDLN